MLRSILVLAVTIVMLLFSANGCKKDSKGPETTEETAKTSADYEAEAKKDINEDNMEQELDKVEQELNREAEQMQ